MHPVTDRRSALLLVAGLLAAALLLAGCGPTVNKRDFDDPPDCATVATGNGGVTPCRPGDGSTRPDTTRPDTGDHPERAAERATYERHRDEWRARRPGAYRYTWFNGCFCPSSLTGPFLVTVRVDTQVVEPAQPGGADPASTVDPGLDRVWRTAGDALAHADSVTIDYDPTFGFPRRIDIDWASGRTDDEESIVVSDFTVLS